MNTRSITTEDPDAVVLARRIIGGSGVGRLDSSSWDALVLAQHLKWCAAGAGVGILGAVGIWLWLRFGHPLAHPIELALSAISIGFLALTGAALFNAIGPALLVFARERMERELADERLAVAESDGFAWRDVAQATAMLVDSGATTSRDWSVAGRSLVRGIVGEGVNLAEVDLNQRSATPGLGLKFAAREYDIAYVLRCCEGSPASLLTDVSVVVIKANPRAAARRIRRRLEVLDRDLSGPELLEVDAKLKYVSILLDRDTPDVPE